MCQMPSGCRLDEKTERFRKGTGSRENLQPIHTRQAGKIGLPEGGRLHQLPRFQRVA